MAYAKKITLKNAVSTYSEGSKKKLKGRFSQFYNFADTAVLPCTAVVHPASSDGNI